MDAIFKFSEINRIAQELWKVGNSKKIWAFFAPMGAGKTTLIHALCDLLQVISPVSSPTFAIINEYESKVCGAIYHMDWYRLKNAGEAINAGVEDCLNSGAFCLIEWPENAVEILQVSVFNIYIEILDEQTRRVFTSFEE